MTAAGRPADTRSRARRRRAYRGLVYKVGAGVMAVGVLVSLASEPLGGVVFGLWKQFLALPGSPEIGGTFSPNNPDVWSFIVAFLGQQIFGTGLWLFLLRLIAELLRLTGRPVLTGNLRSIDKVGLGLLAGGALLGISGEMPLDFIDQLLYEHFSSSDTLIRLLEQTANAGGLLLWGGALCLVLSRPARLRALIGWVDRFGWGRLGHARANKLALALAGVAALAALFGLQGPATSIALIGVGTVLSGIVWDYFFSGRP